MGRDKLIETISLRNLLSFGNDGVAIKLEPLNVLIGPNASGKSNLVEALGLLQAAPHDLTQPIRQGGGVIEWLFKGGREIPVAAIELTVSFPAGSFPLRYLLEFTCPNQRFEVVGEAVENEKPFEGETQAHFFYRYQGGNPVMNVRQNREEPSGSNVGRERRTLPREDVVDRQSVLSQRRDLDQYPELTYLGQQFARIQLYREWSMGRFAAQRLPQRADQPEDFLLEDASNLGMVLNDLQHWADSRALIKQQLTQLHDGFEDVSTKIQGGSVQVYLHEKGLRQPVPATRLSDGTLRYLCLLAILCHPKPPPLLCIEEPELGVHPDILPAIAEMLVDASTRTQLIVTTHSAALVSALSEVPESVLVCEAGETGSTMRRLDRSDLAEWLENYTLGDLWRMGEIGGNRW